MGVFHRARISRSSVRVYVRASVRARGVKCGVESKWQRTMNKAAVEEANGEKKAYARLKIQLYLRSG